MKIFGLLLAVISLSGIILAQVKKPSPAPVKLPYSKSLQAVVVTTPSWASVQGTARLFERKTADSAWKQVGDSFPIVVGRNGLGPDSEFTGLKGEAAKHEGDGKSPAGFFPLTFAFGSSTDPAKTALPYTKLDEYTECVDDVKSTHYNTVVNRMQVGNFDWNSSEKMLAVGPPYESGIFVGYNSYPPVRGNGSCIFLHIWKDATTGTSGCTAMERTNLEKILAWVRQEKNPYLVQLPEAIYAAHEKSWNLPNFK
ncbi:MAG TPA: L,D-transpeptidase family protein [Pyrinomonadaceae bacterium]|nr:L,D-transpeptidase family protein [Pyrinomonadaceae bacterium]